MGVWRVALEAGCKESPEMVFEKTPKAQTKKLKPDYNVDREEFGTTTQPWEIRP
jgi:hypothetical protein